MEGVPRVRSLTKRVTDRASFSKDNEAYPSRTSRFCEVNGEVSSQQDGSDALVQGICESRIDMDLLRLPPMQEPGGRSSIGWIFQIGPLNLTHEVSNATPHLGVSTLTAWQGGADA